MLGKLYLVATPIGNLEDITLRALNVLKQVDYIAAEDTRTTLKLLNYFDIKKPMISNHRHNEDIRENLLIEKLKEGKNIAIVSDAGTPGISDPGEVIVKRAIEEKIDIIPIPGACAAINALIASGLDTKEFTFIGFLPLNKKLRKEKFDEIESITNTIIIYEAPHKIKETLEDLKKFIGNRKIVIARELTKIHEEFIRGDINYVLENFKNVKGEMIILIEGCKNKCNDNILNSLSLDEHYKVYKNNGLEKKDIIKKIAKDRGVSKNEIYQYFIKNN